MSVCGKLSGDTERVEGPRKEIQWASLGWRSSLSRHFGSRDQDFRIPRDVAVLSWSVANAWQWIGRALEQ